MMEENTTDTSKQQEGPIDSTASEPMPLQPELHDGIATAIEQTACRYCSAMVQVQDTFCARCGYPQNGTEAQRKDFKAKLRDMRDAYYKSEKRLSQAKQSLYWVGGLFFAYALIQWMMGSYTNAGLPGWLGFAIDSVIALLFIGSGVWARKQPFAAILTGLLLFVTLILVNLFFDPASIHQGIVLKIIVLIALPRGLVHVRRHQQSQAYLAQNPYVAERILEKK